MHRRYTSPVAALLLALVLCAPPAPGQLPATEYEGATALGLALRRLDTTKRVLMVGAHPDDEATQILGTLALGEGARVAYLSLTRGEGGQNGIGPELQEGLGVLRTEELLAARRLDGAEQFFTRAYDFGYSKSADEAFRHWPRDSLLADAVGVIRTFRPDVVISVFTGTPRDGHGQHQVAGIIAREAFRAAGDPRLFREQIARGLRPHAPAKLFQAFYRPPEAVDFRLPTGEWDPLLGRSAFQVAMASRSRHRSQDMGRPLTPGPQSSAFDLVASNLSVPTEVAERSLFAGIDTTFAAHVEGALGGEGDNGAGHSRATEEVSRLLAEYGEQIDHVPAAGTLLEPGALIGRLANALALLNRAASSFPESGAADLRFVLDQERAEAREALRLAAGISLDAVADAELVVPGQDWGLELTLWNGSDEALAVKDLAPSLPRGWTAEPLDPLPPTLAPGELVTRRFRVRVPPDATPTEAYYLREPRTGDLYVWPDPALAGQPFAPASVAAEATVEIEGTELPLTREATYRGIDKMQGEFRRPVRIVPRVSVELGPALAVVPLAEAEPARDGSALPFTAHVEVADPAGAEGFLRLDLPQGWRSEPETVPLRFEGAAGERGYEFSVTPPPRITPGAHPIAAVFEVEDGSRFTRGYASVDYPHIRPHLIYQPASATVRAFDVRLPPELRVGYVMGAGDEIPAALRQLGIEPELLDEAALGSGDLGRYDVVIIGIRAYEVRPDLVTYNQRVLDYVHGGGTLIVQYNKYEFPEGDFAPYPVSMNRPHDRVTDEATPVRLLAPDHPVLSQPNRITAEDFEGWVQERGLYFLHEWDPQYTPLLEMADPGEEPLHGSLLIAPYGEGTYVYTGLAFFRQLPAGVPGAYRLFANLLALGADR